MTPKKEDKSKKEPVFEENKFSAMKITSSVKKRHQGILEEIQKEIKLNEKYLTDVVSDHERLRRAREMKDESKKCKFVAYQKNQIELKEFIKSK